MHLRKIVLAMALALAPVAAIPAISTPAGAAVISRAAATQQASPAYTIGCTDPGNKYTIAQDNINIRATPDGRILESISKTATFLSLDTSIKALGTVCVTSAPVPAGGTYWVYGESQAHPSHKGWVGVNYMNYITSGIQY
jgi:hypothetical protein